MAWIGPVVAVVLVLSFIGLIFFIIRKNDADERAWKEEVKRDIEWMNQQSEEEHRRMDALRVLPWPELRARCEKVSGKPCECATKGRAAQHIVFAEMRQEAGIR